MSSLLGAIPPIKGLIVLENNVGSSVSPFLGCDEGEWKSGVESREYDRLVPSQEPELDDDFMGDDRTEYD